jgi:hypothetical protein
MTLVRFSRDSHSAKAERVVLKMMLAILLCSPLLAQTNQAPDLSGLSAEERQSVETACSYQRTVVGPAAYYGCVRARDRLIAQLQVRKLWGVVRANAT